MAKNRLQKFRTIDEVQTFLNGGLTGSRLVARAGLGGSPSGVGVAVTGLVGTTMTFTKPVAASVTFVRSDGVGGSATAPGTNPDGSILTFSDIKQQIESAVAGSLVTMFDGALVIREAVPSQGVVIKAGSAGGFPTVVGTVDLNTLAYGAGGTLDTLQLKVKHTGGGTQTVTFAAPANRGAVLTQINGVTSPGIVASINGANQLVLTANDLGAGASIEVVAATGLAALGLTAGVTTGAATNTANPLLGLDAGNDSTGLVYSPPGQTAPPLVAPCWTWLSCGNDNMWTISTWE